MKASSLRNPRIPACIVAWMLLVAACNRGEAARDGLEARGLAALGFSWPPPNAAPAEPSDPNQPDTTRPGIAFAPAVLRVYRATPVELSATPPAHVTAEAWAQARCRWSFGDGTPPQEGCVISHTFARGTSDERVAVTVQLSDTTWETTRIVPLERLPVSAAAPAAAALGADGVPAPPKDGPTSFRMVFVAATGFEDVDWGVVLEGVRRLKPGLVVHAGPVVPEGSEGLDGWERVREGFAEPLRQDGVPVVWALAPSDLVGEAMVRRPAAGLVGDDLELAPGSVFPERYALAFRGVFIAVVTGAEQSKEHIEWLRTRLSEAQVYESRVVVSHLPIHPFSGRSGAVLAPKFKLYELFLRERVSLLATAGHAVFFDGRYGALPVLSVGRLAGPAEALAGHDVPQAPTLAVVDVEGGQLVRTFALERDAAVWRLLDPGYLPETVEVYTR
jgi:hypothetical protein